MPATVPLVKKEDAVVAAARHVRLTGRYDTKLEELLSVPKGSLGPHVPDADVLAWGLYVAQDDSAGFAVLRFVLVDARSSTVFFEQNALKDVIPSQ